jgi:uncharacterized protein (DUF1800 family)
MVAPRHPISRGSVWHTGTPRSSGPRPTGPTPRPESPAFVRHLLSRTSFGVTPELASQVRSSSSWLTSQLSPATIDDSACDAIVARWPLAKASAPSLEAAFPNGGWEPMQQLVEATLARSIWSKRQLFEVMVEFWSNHLNITCPSSEVWSTKPADDQNVLRKHALGRFEDMLIASSTSPAMLRYLNNAESQGDDINENYGRELLELHTVGVNAGYTHTDIINAARVMSGLTVWNAWNGGTAANQGTLRYRADWHYVGAVTVLGWSHPNTDATQGKAVADSLVRYLANRPETARRIATKLAVRFVSDNPPTSLVDKLTATYLTNGTAVVPMLKQLFASAEFAASVGQKQRRPLEDFVGTLRTLGVTANPDPNADLSGITWLLGQLGQAPMGWGLPDGYPDVASAWTGAGGTLGRWNAHFGLAAGWWSDSTLAFQADLPTYLLGATKPTTRGALVDALLKRLQPTAVVPPAHRAALIAFLGPDGSLHDSDLDWLFAPLVALVLNMPQGCAR